MRLALPAQQPSLPARFVSSRTRGPPVIPDPVRILAGLEVESDPPPRALAWLPWPARQGGPHDLYKPRRHPLGPSPVP
jgi:hypothetical protein